MVSTTLSPFTVQKASGWSGSTTRILLESNAEASNRITAID